MITVMATVIVLGVLIFIHEFGHFLLAKLCGVRVKAFSLGFPPRLLHKQIGETDYRLSVIPLGGYVKMLGENPNDEIPPELEHRSFQHHSLWHRFLIVLAGPIFNFLFAIVALFLLFALAGIPYPNTEIGDITAGAPAAKAKLEKGDMILAVGGQPVKRWEDLSAKIKKAGEHPVTMEIKREKKVWQVMVTPQRQEITDEFGGKISTVLIGIRASNSYGIDRVGPLVAFKQGTTDSLNIAWMTLKSIYKLLAREVPLKTLAGPIFIAQVAGRQAEAGVTYLIHFMAMLSINLAMLNLLPIPILDGGHLFFIIWEAILGKPVPIKYREMAQALGLMLILALMTLVLYQDVLRLFAPN